MQFGFLMANWTVVQIRQCCPDLVASSGRVPFRALQQLCRTSASADDDECKQPRHSPLHRMLIDECQDLTQAELSLLLEVAHDKDALYLCGDTAQTISRGVGFRFADVRTPRTS